MNTLQTPKKFSGKWFSPEDLVQINGMITSSPDANRAALSRMVCDAFEWYKINGGLKEMSCRVAMLRMEREGLIKLPPPKKRNGPASCKRTKATEPQIVFSDSIKELGPIRLELVKQSNSRLWNEYIDRYHYLGYKPLPGAQLRYFAYANDRFQGTCYLAANWICLGRTQGKGKKGSYLVNIPMKSVWVYPLDKNARQKLCEGTDNG